MPVITVTMRKTSKEIKRELVRQLTETGTSVTGVPDEHFTVLISELDDGNLGLAGRTLEEVFQAS